MVTPVLAHGMGHFVTLFPLIMVGAAIFVIVTAMRDGSDKTRSTRTLPTSPLSRQVHAATRRRGSERSTAPSSERPGRRSGAPHLQVMDGEAADGNRPALPRRFEPPPPQRRRKTG
jgi:hypothetical protein